MEVYALLPPGDEVATLGARIPPGSSVLDLGAGTGRLADPLVDLGYRVVAVDNSPAMLARVQRARTVLSDIGHLRLDERFDAVLLASHLVNVPDQGARRALLATVSHHLERAGRGWIQWHPPDWFDGLRVGVVRSGRLGDVAIDLVVTGLDHDVVTATVTYRVGDAEWRQHFSTRKLDMEHLVADLAAVGLVMARRPGDGDSWFEVRVGPTAGG